MVDIFLEVFNRSVTAGWLILVVLFLRILLRRTPKKYFVILWALVGVRLILPFSPTSKWSMIPSFQTIPKDALLSGQPVINSGISIVDNTLNPLAGRLLTSIDEPEESKEDASSIDGTTDSTDKRSGYALSNPKTEQLSNQHSPKEDQASDASMPDADSKAKTVFRIAKIAALTWIIGVLLMHLYALINYYFIRRKVEVSFKIGDGIRVCDYVDSPFILGILNPCIYLPSDISDNDAFYVLAHERAHLGHKDNLWKPIGYLLLSIYWINPLVWAAFIMFCRDIEFACDEHVVNGFEPEEKTNYASTLLKLSILHREAISLPLTFGEVSVKQRIKNVLKHKKAERKHIMAWWLAFFAFVLCFMTNPKPMSARQFTLPKHNRNQLIDDNTLYADTDAHKDTSYLISDRFMADSDDSHKHEIIINTGDFTTEDLHKTVEEYVSELLHVFEEGNMRTFSPQEFASINGYIVAKSLINDRISYMEQNGEGIRHLSISVQIDSDVVENKDSILVGAEGTMRYSANGHNWEIRHHYNVTVVNTNGELQCKDIDTDDDENVVFAKKQISDLKEEEKVAYVDHFFKSEEAMANPMYPLRRAILEYTESITSSANGANPTDYSADEFETVNGYLAAKYYQTLREWYQEKGYTVKDHHATGVIIDSIYDLENSNNKRQKIVEGSICCVYTDPVMGTLQHYTRRIEVLLEMSGETAYRIVGFNSIGSHEIEEFLNDNLMTRDEKIVFIDNNIREAVISDGLLPMDNK